MPTDALILVKHAMPVIVPEEPPRTWKLSDEGRLAAARLGSGLAAYAPLAVVTIVEPKAAETGQIIAASLDVPVMTAPGLHEHERDVMPFDGTERFHSGSGRNCRQPWSWIGIRFGFRVVRPSRRPLST